MAEEIAPAPGALASSTPPVAPTPAAPTSGDPAPPAAERPAWVPEKFWDAGKGVARYEDLAKSYSELDKHRTKAGEAARAEMLSKRPAKPEEYEVKAPEDMADLVILTGEPPKDFAPEEGKVYFALNPASEAMKAAREAAWKHGMPADEFGKVVSLLAREMGTRIPTAEERTARDAAANRAVYNALGEHGQRETQFVWGQMVTQLGEADAKELDVILTTPGAIRAMGKLMVAAGRTSFAASGATGSGSGPLTEGKLREMMRDPRYADPMRRDEAFAAEVTRGYQTLYPGKLQTA